MANDSSAPEPKKKRQLWDMVNLGGQPRKFETQEELYNACLKYFEWATDNPIYDIKPFHFQGVVTLEKIPKPRIFTVQGMCLFLNINRDSWYQWAKEDRYSDTVKAINNIIFEQKYSGAAVDIFNSGLVARDLGLRDITAIDHTSSDGSMSPNIDVSKLSPQVMDELLQAHDNTNKS
jgi:hypothetical protein